MNFNFANRLMSRCPSCHGRTISLWHKWWGCSAFPARCANCGAPCVVPSSRSSGIALACVLFVTMCGFAAAALHAVSPLSIGASAALFFYVRRWYLFELQVISAENISRAQKESGVTLVVTVLLWFVD
ncbi:MAG TPA: hypothetical protein PLS67_14360 [Accumulibacter sp.]|nr:hypothetical protein [Accumulibacter sp.]HQC81671.1 hypothetical protein [Accumulibacter sp.]